MKIIGETWFLHMATQAETVNWLGAKYATCEILRFSENLENHWKKQGFEHLHQVARTKTDPWTPAAHWRWQMYISYGLAKPL